MADLTDAEIDAALERGRQAGLNEPRAEAARYDRSRHAIEIEFANGIKMSIPVGLLQGLEAAAPTYLAKVEILGGGTGLHWHDLDVDLSVPGLVSHVLGTKSHMARIAGKTRSDAKAAAARVNGRKGGRPPVSSTAKQKRSIVAASTTRRSATRQSRKLGAD